MSLILTHCCLSSHKAFSHLPRFNLKDFAKRCVSREIAVGFPLKLWWSVEEKVVCSLRTKSCGPTGVTSNSTDIFDR